MAKKVTKKKSGTTKKKAGTGNGSTTSRKSDGTRVSSPSKGPAKKKSDEDVREIMIVNDLPGEECRVAILQDNHLEELYAERVATATNVGNIYKGRVTNVEPAIQAAFVDYGCGQSGFLHISDLHPKHFPGKEQTERVGKKIPRRQRPPIQNALRRGDEIVVQVMKEGIGTKGPTLTGYPSIPGRMLVMMPDMDRVGVSRKVEDEEKRREMRQILDSLDLPDGFGFILRTAGFEKTKTDLKRDVAYLMRLWKVMENRIKTHSAPCELYTESDLLIRTIRDVLRPSIEAIVVDSRSAYDRAKGFLSVVAPRSAPKIYRHTSSTPIFHAFDIERQIELIHSREVPLPSGGAIVIDQTEALVAIDVNSGKSRSAKDAESNAFNTNCEAVDEIARQLRLRDLGGLVINDLIDMRSMSNRRSIEERFRHNLKRDRARSTILRTSSFGIIEMTRQRMRPSIGKADFVPCPHCQGHGEIKSPEYIGSYAVRHCGFLLQHKDVARVEIVCSPRVASYLLSNKRRALVDLEDDADKQIDVRVSEAIAADRVDFYAYDLRNADIDTAKLPIVRVPTMQDLDAGIQSPMEEAAEAPTTSSRRRRRRGRRGRGEKDAAATEAVVEAAETDVPTEPETEPETEPAAESAEETPAEAPTTSGRRRRRRGRRGKGEKTEVAAEAAGEKAEPVEKAAEPEPEPEPIRLHLLARQLGVPSRDVLARCREAGHEVKNHMSTVSSELVTLIRGWFAPEPEPEPEPEPAKADAEAAAADETEGEPKKKRSRRRRSRRGSGEKKAEAPDAPAPEPEPAPEADAEPGTKKKRRRRSRRKTAEVEVVGPVAAATVPASTDGEPASKPKRRSLYRSRTNLAAGTRPAGDERD